MVFLTKFWLIVALALTLGSIFLSLQISGQTFVMQSIGFLVCEEHSTKDNLPQKG